MVLSHQRKQEDYDGQDQQQFESEDHHHHHGSISSSFSSSQSPTARPQRIIVAKIPLSSALPPKPRMTTTAISSTHETPRNHFSSVSIATSASTSTSMSHTTSPATQQPYDESPIARLRLKTAQKKKKPSINTKQARWEEQEKALQDEIAELDRKEKELTANILTLIDDRVYDEHDQDRDDEALQSHKETIDFTKVNKRGPHRGSFLRGIFREQSGRTPVPLVRQDSLQSMTSFEQQQILPAVPSPTTESLSSLCTHRRRNTRRYETPSFDGLTHGSAHSETIEDEEKGGTFSSQEIFDEDTPVWKRRLVTRHSSRTKLESDTAVTHSYFDENGAPLSSVLDIDSDEEEEEDDDDGHTFSTKKDTTKHDDKHQRRGENDYTQKVISDLQDWWTSTMDATSNSLVQITANVEENVDDASTAIFTNDEEYHEDNKDEYTEDKSRRLSFPASLEVMLRRNLSPLFSCSYYAAQVAYETIEDPAFERAWRDVTL